MNRRHFLERAAGAGAMALASPFVSACQRVGSQKQIARIAFVKTADRTSGVSRAIDLLRLPSLSGKNLFIKPNFNSADAPPGSTHIDTLTSLIQKLRQLGAGPLTIGDRSGMGNTREVMEAKEIFRLAKDMNLKTVVLDELPASEWELIKNANTLAEGICVATASVARGRYRANLLLEDAPVWRPLYAFVEKLSRAGGEIRAGRPVQLHARTSRLSAPTSDDCGDQRRLSASTCSAGWSGGVCYWRTRERQKG